MHRCNQIDVGKHYDLMQVVAAVMEELAKDKGVWSFQNLALHFR